MQFSLKRIKWRVATKPTDKEYDRYKGLEHLTLVPILRKIFDELLEYFSETRSALFHPQPNELRPGRGSDDQLDSVFGLALLDVFF